jgi:hypothetical protein
MGGPANNRYGPKNSISSYLPDEFQLPDDENEFKEFYAERERITSSVLNIREIGQYQLQELLTAQTWFPIANTNAPGKSNIQRYVFRKVIQSGQLPNNSIQTIPHGINMQPTGFFTNMYATSNDGTTYIMVPYSAPAPGQITIYADRTNVYIQTYESWAGYNNTNVILEYIKA